MRAAHAHQVTAARRAPQAFAPAPPPRRVFPPPGRLLRASDIRGPWWPGIDVGALFVVRWDLAHGGVRWAPLHDFEPAAVEWLLAEASRSDRVAYGVRFEPPRRQW